MLSSVTVIVEPTVAGMVEPLAESPSVIRVGGGVARVVVLEATLVGVVEVARPFGAVPLAVKAVPVGAGVDVDTAGAVAGAVAGGA